jgi:hypothetical protein
MKKVKTKEPKIFKCQECGTRVKGEGRESMVDKTEARISGTIKDGIYYPLQIDLSDYSPFQKKAILALTECCEGETINVDKFIIWLGKNVDTLDEEGREQK